MPRGAAPGERRGGRAKGKKNKKTEEYIDFYRKAEVAACEALTPEQIKALTPRDVLMMAMQVAVTGKNLALAAKSADAIAPYEHSKKAPTQAGAFGDEAGVIRIVGGLPDEADDVP